MDNIRAISPKDFPVLLSEIADPPKQLFVRGQLPSDDYKFLAVVGSRKYSSYGKEVCEKLVSGLAGYPIVIISGLALGIDAIAHSTALRAGLTTVAVPGSGISDQAIYPRTHLRLAHEILKSGGALLSEFQPEMKATPYTFPQRNRIMAGLSHAVLLIEASEKSGTLITARMASEYNRELLCVPGSIFSPNSTGVHQFLKLGATPVTDSDDILSLFGFETSQTSRNYEDVSEAEKEIIEILMIEPLSRDELIMQLEKPAHEISVTLSMMEIKDLIRESQGKIYLV